MVHNKMWVFFSLLISCFSVFIILIITAVKLKIVVLTRLKIILLIVLIVEDRGIGRQKA